jgi:hypothetical protein
LLKSYAVPVGKVPAIRLAPAKLNPKKGVIVRIAFPGYVQYAFRRDSAAIRRFRRLRIQERGDVLLRFAKYSDGTVTAARIRMGFAAGSAPLHYSKVNSLG